MSLALYLIPVKRLIVIRKSTVRREMEEKDEEDMYHAVINAIHRRGRLVKTSLIITKLYKIWNYYIMLFDLNPVPG